MHFTSALFAWLARAVRYFQVRANFITTFWGISAAGEIKPRFRPFYPRLFRAFPANPRDIPANFFSLSPLSPLCQPGQC